MKVAAKRFITTDYDLERENGIAGGYAEVGGVTGEIYNASYTKTMLQTVLSR